ncbi:hypothetical protein TNIN_465191 [Trichonephila inaurata madagascariensis]|uniref:Uncharacterized protein n=1 Tax=Trichonephila inaurata madagascariensis TaxID=2747483 RepID=A0A8X6XQA3_9ARAC|nr:hypothetical protein TNIN_465191 [Trichonephila inaurata madagascariensis]
MIFVTRASCSFSVLRILELSEGFSSAYRSKMPVGKMKDCPIFPFLERSYAFRPAYCMPGALVGDVFVYKCLSYICVMSVPVFEEQAKSRENIVW